MVQLVKKWFQRYFENPEVSILCLFMVFVVVLFYFFGKMLAPVLASVVVAYLLQWFVMQLERWRVPHMLAVIVVYMGFIGAVVLALFKLLPLLFHQLSNLINEFPVMLGHVQALLMQVPPQYQQYVSEDQVLSFLGQFKLEIAHFGQYVLSVSLASISSIIVVGIYLILVPLLVYFFLMDRQQIFVWFGHYLPNNRRLISQVWHEVNMQIGNYVRGKVLEMIIVWLVAYVVFAVLGLQYAMLLSLLVGVSVIIPYIGAVVVTVPVVIIAFLQWGWTTDFAYLLIAYTVMLVVDGNVLVPLLFSETVDLHPIAIIIAVLVFGGLWGFWGVFFAIPLATLVKAILNALPSSREVAV